MRLDAQSPQTSSEEGKQRATLLLRSVSGASNEDYSPCRFDLARAWGKSKQAVCKGCTLSTVDKVQHVKIRWSNVCGLVSNMVATVYAG